MASLLEHPLHEKHYGEGRRNIPSWHTLCLEHLYVVTINQEPQSEMLKSYKSVTNNREPLSNVFNVVNVLTTIKNAIYKCVINDQDP